MYWDIQYAKVSQQEWIQVSSLPCVQKTKWNPFKSTLKVKFAEDAAEYDARAAIWAILGDSPMPPREAPNPQPKPKKRTAADILDAVKKVLTEREGNYDHPRKNFERIAIYWTAYLESKLRPGEKVTPEDTGMLMILMKVAREQHKHGEDNLMDTIGYSVCVLRCADEVGHEVTDV